MRRFLLTTTMLAGATFMGLALPTSAGAETLGEALAMAYKNNPTLEAARAQQRATDENVPNAKSGYLPTIQAEGNYSRQKYYGLPSPTGPNDPINAYRGTADPRGYDISVTQNVFKGFQTLNNVREAENQVKAGQGLLKNTEQQVLLDGVSAYQDVIRAQAELDLNRNNVDVLRRQLDATRDRFRVGEITRTDVAQSEARLSSAISDRVSAEAALSAARETYRRVIGQMPGTLEVGALPALPASEDEAVAVATRNNPALEAARYNEQAAKYARRAAEGALAPSVNVSGQYSYQDSDINSPFNPLGAKTKVGTVGARLTIPFYQSGAEYARIRQAAEVRSQRMMQIYEAERQVTEQASTAWWNLNAASERIKSAQEAVRSNEVALEGVRQEAQVGSRTVLDTLNAEQELLNSRVALVRAKRDEQVAAYQLLSAIGSLDHDGLSLAAERYDPTQHYDKVKNKFIGW